MGILTRGQVAAGIGNAYSDEILFAPASSLSQAHQPLARRGGDALSAMRDVLSEAIPILRERVGEEIHNEVRDFLQCTTARGNLVRAAARSFPRSRSNSAPQLLPPLSACSLLRN
jgi:formamidopyrimidine-DNA glycosylase